MKNKIQKFSKGDFQLIRPDVIFDETNLVLIIGEGEVYRGSFTMRANNEGRIRGLVYSSSFRVHFKDQGFEGNPSRVEFTYDGRGLRPGHVEEGKFTIVCSGGEYELSFTAIIEKPYVMTTFLHTRSVYPHRCCQNQIISNDLPHFRLSANPCAKRKSPQQHCQKLISSQNNPARNNSQKCASDSD